MKKIKFTKRSLVLFASSMMPSAPALVPLSLALMLSSLALVPSAQAASPSPMEPKLSSAPSALLTLPPLPSFPSLPGDSSAVMSSPGTSGQLTSVIGYGSSGPSNRLSNLPKAPRSSGIPQLGGVFSGTDAKSWAVLDDKVVAVGQQHGPWTLTQVTNESVTLKAIKAGGRELKLSLFSGNSSSNGFQSLGRSKQKFDSKIKPQGITKSDAGNAD